MIFDVPDDALHWYAYRYQEHGGPKRATNKPNRVTCPVCRFIFMETNLDAEAWEAEQERDRVARITFLEEHNRENEALLKLADQYQAKRQREIEAIERRGRVRHAERKANPLRLVRSSHTHTERDTHTHGPYLPPPIPMTPSYIDRATPLPERLRYFAALGEIDEHQVLEAVDEEVREIEDDGAHWRDLRDETHDHP